MDKDTLTVNDIQNGDVKSSVITDGKSNFVKIGLPDGPVTVSLSDGTSCSLDPLLAQASFKRGIQDAGSLTEAVRNYSPLRGIFNPLSQGLNFDVPAGLIPNLCKGGARLR